MIFYDFKCDKCDIIWEKEYARIPKSAKKMKCPQCNKWAQRYYSANSCPTVKIAGTKHKVGQSDLNRVYNEMIDDSKERLKLQNQHKNTPYKSYVPDYKKMVEEGTLKPCSEKRVKQKMETAKHLTAHAFEKAGKDPRKFTRTNETRRI